MFADKIYNIKSRKNLLKIWEIFSLLGCKFYANKSVLNLIMFQIEIFLFREIFCVVLGFAEAENHVEDAGEEDEAEGEAYAFAEGFGKFNGNDNGGGDADAGA